MMTRKDNNPADLDENDLHDFCDWFEENRDKDWPEAMSIDGFQILTAQAIASYFYAKEQLQKMEKKILLGTRLSNKEAQALIDDASDISIALENVMGNLRLYREYNNQFSTPLRTMLMNHRKENQK